MAEQRLSVTQDNTGKIKEALIRLSKSRVLVGIPSGAKARKDDPITNAQLGYLHEYGAPANNLPARPFLVPGVTKSKAKWTNYLEQAGVAAFEGKASVVTGALNAAGQTAVSAVKDTISQGIPPPLSARTYAGRIAKSPGIGPPSATPLIDTSQMINSITYVIERRK